MKKSIQKLVLAATGAMLALNQASAIAAITYTDADLLLGFRDTAAINNLQVTLGDVSQITGIFGTGQTLDFSSKFNLAEINAAFGDFNSVSFGVTAVRRAGGDGYANNTLWITKGRTDVNVQTSTPNRFSNSVQGNTGTRIESLGNSMNGVPGTLDHPNTAVQTSAANATSYSGNYKTSGNINGTIGYSSEVTTASDFAAGSKIVRLDLYEMIPTSTTGGTAGTLATSGQGLYLGFFEMGNNGAFTFTAVPEASTYAAAFAGGLMLLALARVHRKSAV